MLTSTKNANANLDERLELAAKQSGSSDYLLEVFGNQTGVRNLSGNVCDQ